MSVRTCCVAPGKKFGVSELGADVVSYISHAAQQRLQDLLEKVSHVAQLKNQMFKVTLGRSRRVNLTPRHLARP